jgi:integral membrane sensor domain MASE1
LATARDKVADRLPPRLLGLTGGQVTIIALVLVLGHPAVLIAANPGFLEYFDPRVNLPRALSLGAVTGAMLLIVATSIWRLAFRLNYEWWRVVHGVLAAFIVFIGVVHGWVWVVLAAGLSTLLSATLGVTSGWLGGVIPTDAYGRAWWTWWLGDVQGVLLFAPPILTFNHSVWSNLTSRAGAARAAWAAVLTTAARSVGAATAASRPTSR